ncbi:hypothetical protein ACQV5J_16200 [Leptospira interrogans]|uniref:hypothetical protein n=1 Tax=Leptospira interrogans TaxID=173 RepID=UPI0009D57FB6|nr:hypothetical protein [Leptospira interrogans]OOB99147.1 hypothetical protein B0192_07100 [Leptospira interrogans serovar Australis]
MNLLERAKTFIFSSQNSFVAAPEIKKFKDSRREVKEYFSDVSPNYPLEMLPILDKLSLINSDFNQSIKRTILLLNTGFDWKLEGASKATEDAAILDLAIWDDNHPGLTNGLMRQLAVMGALSAEGVPSLDLSEIEEIQLIPVAEIRFKKQKIEGKNGEVRYKYAPFQELKNGSLIPLNQLQYTYEALEKSENNPYAIPPAISAIDAMFTQAKATASIKRMITKWGLLGFISVILKKFRLPYGADLKSESTEQERYLKNATRDIEKSIDSGLLVGTEGTQIQHNSITSDKSSSFQDVWRVNEEQIASGLNIDLFMLGRSYSVTETYAKFAAILFLIQGENIRHVVKRFMEKTMTLHLRMKGYKFTRLKATWKKGRSLTPENDAVARKTDEEAETVRVNRILSLADRVIISDDQAAKEIGYEKATGTRVSKNALHAILRRSGIDPLSEEGKRLVNTYEHLFKRKGRGSKKGSEQKFPSSDENHDNLIDFEEELEKKNGTRTTAVRRGRKH